jgi:hypothetical protein
MLPIVPSARNDAERVVRQIRMLRATRRELETALRLLLLGHEGRKPLDTAKETPTGCRASSILSRFRSGHLLEHALALQHDSSILVTELVRDIHAIEAAIQGMIRIVVPVLVEGQIEPITGQLIGA